MKYPEGVKIGDKFYKIPFAEDVPFDEKQFTDLEADIRTAKAVQIPVVLWEEQSTATTETVIDGAHRLLIASKLGLPQVPTVYLSCESEEAARSACRRLNEHRRQLTQEQLESMRKERVTRVVAMRKEGASLRAIAKAEGVSGTTIIKYLKVAEESGIQVEPTSGKVMGRDKRSQPSRKPLRPKLFGDPINFRGLRHAPINEQGVVFLFGMVAQELDFLVEAVQGPYPDCEGKRKKRVGKYERVRIEFEFVSRNFKEHGHDPTGCDLIVCWEDNWPECPIEVLALKDIIGRLKA